jgi:CubicO group peptidase (beta-lactamase class C family)
MPTLDESLDDALAAAVVNRVPGAAAGIVHCGESIVRCSGWADLEASTPVTPDTVFQIGSISKPFTALTVYQLAQAGLIDLDGPLSAYLPDYPALAAAVRVWHLLTHTSGIPNFLTQPGFRSGPARLDHTGAELIDRFAQQPLLFEPGTRYSYSNSGYRLLEQIVAATTGAPWTYALASQVLDPAGLARTRVLTDADIVPGRARGYMSTEDGYRNAPYFSLSIAGGAGGLGSTVTDLLAFDRALAGQVFGPATLDNLARPVRLASGRTEGYGFGLASGVYRGHRLIWHGGGTEGFSGIYVRAPDDDLAVVLLTNGRGFDAAAVARRLIDARLGTTAPSTRTAPMSPSSLDRRTGRYGDGIDTLEISAGDGGLRVDADGVSYRMRPVADDRFVAADDPDVTLEFPADDQCVMRFPLFWISAYKSAGHDTL